MKTSVLTASLVALSLTAGLAAAENTLAWKKLAQDSTTDQVQPIDPDTVTDPVLKKKLLRQQMLKKMKQQTPDGQPAPEATAPAPADTPPEVVPAPEVKPAPAPEPAPAPAPEVKPAPAPEPAPAPAPEVKPAPAPEPAPAPAPETAPQPKSEVTPAPAAPAPAPETAAPAPAPESAAPVTVPAAPAVTPEVKQKDVQKLDANPVDPVFEDKAKALLADKTDVASLSDEDLRKRLEAIRDLLASNKLSPETEKALRGKLAAERTVLRNRMAAKEQQQVPPAPPAPPTGGMTGMTANPPPPPPPSGGMTATPPPAPPAAGMSGMGGMGGMSGMTANAPAPRPGMDPSRPDLNRKDRDAWLRDRRPAQDLREDELRIRIDAYIDASRDPYYDEPARLRWREAVMHDRRFLRDRMMHDRDRRRNALEAEFGKGNFNIRLGYDLGPDYRPPRRDVFAAEVDDEMLEEVLVAPPREKPQRRYTVQEIEARPEVRRLLPRVEIDTVHFGFNEAFVREEEVGKLDRIASLMERILKAHPQEIFLIEGHTDAVGSDAYNLDLSRARAEAVKKALSTYYIIPGRNLRTAGMGERYLRIPTAEAEAENRRVSVSRATDLIGQAQ